MEFGTSGDLGHGKRRCGRRPAFHDGATANGTADGIHVDMDRLKKGEVK